MDTNDVVSSVKDISPSRMREIMNERNQSARDDDAEEGDASNAGGTEYHLMGIYTEVKDLSAHDTRNFVRLADTHGTVDVYVTSPLPPSIKFGQPVRITVRLVAEEKPDANKMEDVADARAQEALHAVRVVPLRQNVPHGYHELVADKLLATNPRIVLPVWLVRWFSESTNFYSDLLRIYLCHNRLEDATFVAVGILFLCNQFRHSPFFLSLFCFFLPFPPPPPALMG